MQLPCPLCGHLHPVPIHFSKFNCKGCKKPLELSKDASSLQDFTARKAAEKARVDQYWHKVAEEKAKKEGIDFKTAHTLVLAGRDKNSQKMREAWQVKSLFPPLPPVPRPKTGIPTPQPTKPTESRAIPADDFTEAPWD